MSGTGFSVPGHQQITVEQALSLLHPQLERADKSMEMGLKIARTHAIGAMVAALVTAGTTRPSITEVRDWIELLTSDTNLGK